ncbi:hypothetical protein [Embleya sp. NPDC050493]|uniref:hypothetical protein n=1 Tax=Embleya sp. NPDC050493 TaxID=3363989 RepID=UPI0037B7847E
MSASTHTDVEKNSIEAMQAQLTEGFLALCADPDDAEAAGRADGALHALDVLLAPDAAGSPADGPFQ